MAFRLPLLAAQSDFEVITSLDFRFSRIDADGTINTFKSINPQTGVIGGLVSEYVQNQNIVLKRGFDSTIFNIAIQSDGKILVGGQFLRFDGNIRRRLVRLNSNATEDTDFGENLGEGFNNTVRPVTISPGGELSDGKILVGGQFTSFDGNTRNRLVRLNSNGTEDTAFYNNLGSAFSSTIETIASSTIDLKILVGGAFNSFAGSTRNRLVRLNESGTEDTAFYNNLGSGFNSAVNNIAIQSDGKILVGGVFTSFNGNTRNRLVRLNSNGTEDTDFYDNLGSGFNGTIRSIAIQSDGKILVCGFFNSFDENTRNRLVRLNSNGTEDTDFYDNLGEGFSSTTTNIAIQSDGKILVCGSFTSFNENTRNRLVRLNSNGTEDTDFGENFGDGFNSGLNDIAIQSDGKILVGGQFT